MNDSLKDDFLNILVENTHKQNLGEKTSKIINFCKVLSPKHIITYLDNECRKSIQILFGKPPPYSAEIFSFLRSSLVLIMEHVKKIYIIDFKNTYDAQIETLKEKYPPSEFSMKEKVYYENYTTLINVIPLKIQNTINEMIVHNEPSNDQEFKTYLQNMLTALRKSTGPLYVENE